MVEPTDRIRSQYKRELAIEYKAEAEQAVSKLACWTEEKLSWLKRIDIAIDEIADLVGAEIPYGIDGGEWASKNEVRYNPAYRLELLKGCISEARRSQKEGEDG
jgi:hypothetical protein